MTKLLFDRIKADMIPRTLADKTLPADVREGVIKTYRESTVFLNEDALRQVIDGEVDIDELPSFAPPYNTFFIESLAPSSEKRVQLPSGDGKVQFNFGRRVGALFTSYETHKDSVDGDGWVTGCIPVDESEIRWRMDAYLFVETPNLDFQWFANIVVFLDSDGKPAAFLKDDQIGYSYIKLNEEFLHLIRNMAWRDNDYQFAVDGWYEYAGMVLNASMYTLGMLHCRNIGSEIFQPSAAESHKYQKKNGFPMHSYHILKITGKGKDAGELIGNATGRNNRLHWVRAHWRTYTDAAPLFGSVTGTFYVREFVRGDIRNGTVTKDYDVKVNKNRKSI